MNEGGTRRALVPRIEAGEPVDRIAAALGLGPMAFLAALAGEGFEIGGAPGLVRGEPRSGALPDAIPDEALARLLPGSSGPARLAVAAGVLQVFDHWEASHEAAQRADDLGEKATSAYWHGIAHRREPDAWNAGYWFRRVGRHPILPEVGAAAHEILRGQSPDPPANRLVRAGIWEPTAFVDFCERARPGNSAGALGLKLQRAEMLALLRASVAAAGGLMGQ